MHARSGRPETRNFSVYVPACAHRIERKMQRQAAFAGDVRYVCPREKRAGQACARPPRKSESHAGLGGHEADNAVPDGT